MKPRVELGLTIAVCVLGAIYFVYRAIVADDDDRLLYIGFVIIGGIFAQRAIKDVLEKMRRAESDSVDDGVNKE